MFFCVNVKEVQDALNKREDYDFRLKVTELLSNLEKSLAINGYSDFEKKGDTFWEEESKSGAWIGLEIILGEERDEEGDLYNEPVVFITDLNYPGVSERLSFKMRDEYLKDAIFHHYGDF